MIKHQRYTTLDNYRIELHTLKSSLGIIGNIPLSNMAKDLEYAAKDGQMDIIAKKTPELLGYLKKIPQHFEKAFGYQKADKPLLTDEKLFGNFMKRLLAAAEDMDINEMDDIMSEINVFSYEKERDIMIKELSKLVYNLETEEVIELIENYYKN